MKNKANIVKYSAIRNKRYTVYLKNYGDEDSQSYNYANLLPKEIELFKVLLRNNGNAIERERCAHILGWSVNKVTLVKTSLTENIKRQCLILNKRGLGYYVQPHKNDLRLIHTEADYIFPENLPTSKKSCKK